MLSKSAGRSPGRSLLSSPVVVFLRHPHLGSDPVAMSDIGECCGLSSVEECVQWVEVLSPRNIHLCGLSFGGFDPRFFLLLLAKGNQ